MSRGRARQLDMPSRSPSEHGGWVALGTCHPSALGLRGHQGDPAEFLLTFTVKHRKSEDAERGALGPRALQRGPTGDKAPSSGRSPGTEDMG